MKLRAARVLIVAAIALLALACRAGNIYYTLENEVEEPDLSLPNDIIVFDVALLSGSYYAAAGKIWTVPVATLDGGGGWVLNQVIPAPTTNALCTALVASPFGGAHTDTLYGGFINPSGNLGLYESSATPTATSATWTAVADPDVAGAQIAQLKVENSLLAAVVAKQPSAGADYEFSLVTSADGAAFAAATITRDAGEEAKPINDVIYSPTLGKWFFTEGAYLYSGPLTGMAHDASIDAKTTSGEVLYGLFDDGTNVYVSSWDRNKEAECAVYYTADGTTWTRTVVPADNSGVHAPLTRFALLTGTTEKVLLVGSDGYGYFSLPTSPTVGSLTRFATTTSDLYPAAVRKFFVDAAASRVFACSALSGLWRGAYDADASISWTQE
jgi:hypothetical protein